MKTDLRPGGPAKVPGDERGGTGAAEHRVPLGETAATPWRPWSERDEGVKRPKRRGASSAGPKAAPRARELFPKALRPADVAGVEASGAVLSKLLACPELEGVAREVGQRLAGGDRERFERSLGAFALLADAALTTLDYDRMTTGWDGWSDYGFKYPSSRTEYRERRYRHDLEATSRPRQDRSKVELLEAVGRALDAPDPAGALDAALVDRFLTEVGVSPERREGWRPDPHAVARALDGEALIPLRALYAAAAHLDHRGVPAKGLTERELNHLSRSFMEEVIRHVAEGDFADWRFEHAASRAQLATLSEAQLAAYREPGAVEVETRSKRRLTTRDEQGLELLWVTKIGGPSHGFDMLSQCLFGLLGNARNGAIVVDDPQHQGAARSVIRLLPTTNNKPVLFLEMLQVDYPFERAPVTRDELRLAIVRHALAKAERMGVPLAIAPSRWEQAEVLLEKAGAKGKRMPLELVLEPSGGVFESSDTLLGAHHAPQVTREVTRVPNKKSMISFGNPNPCVVNAALLAD